MKDENGGVMSQSEQQRQADELEGIDSSFILHPSTLVPWEQIENGRYQPRRIRGSCIGRELG
jgi:hypothetical protein